MTTRIAITLVAACAVMLTFTGTTQAAPRAAWERVAACESGGDWHINTGNGYHGGLQFTPETWRSHGGKGNAEDASKDEQIAVAERVLAHQGWGAWPVCSRRAGLR